MLNLLKVELKTLLKFKPARWMFVLFPIFAGLFAAMFALNEEPPMTALFNGLFMINLISVAVGSLFLYTDFSQNTIRNKIVVGHTRSSVCAAKFVVILIFYITCIFLYMVPSFIIDYLLLDTKNILWEAIGKNLVIVFCNVFINAAMMVCLTTAIKGIVGAIMPFVVTEGLCVGGTLWLEILSVDNPELCEVIMAVPNIESMMLSPLAIPANVGLSCAIAIVETIFLLLVGYLSFRKADLN